MKLGSDIKYPSDNICAFALLAEVESVDSKVIGVCYYILVDGMYISAYTGDPSDVRETYLAKDIFKEILQSDTLPIDYPAEVLADFIVRHRGFIENNANVGMRVKLLSFLNRYLLNLVDEIHNMFEPLGGILKEIL